MRAHLLKLLNVKLTITVLIDHRKELCSLCSLVRADIAIAVQIKERLELVRVEEAIAIGIGYCIVLRQRHLVLRIGEPHLRSTRGGLRADQKKRFGQKNTPPSSAWFFSERPARW